MLLNEISYIKRKGVYIMKKKMYIVLSVALALFTVLLQPIQFNPISMNAVAADNESVTEYAVGDIVEFGSYPQTKVTDVNLVMTLNSLCVNGTEWISYHYYDRDQSSDYMRYTDITYNNVRYRGVVFDTYRAKYTSSASQTTPNLSNQYNNGYQIGTVYWF